MLKFEHIRPVKKKVEAHLRTYPGVHAVGMGEKYVNGKPSGEPSIVVLVVEKKPLDQLKPEEVIPSEIEGIKTDVIQVPMPRLDMAGDPSNLTVTVAPDGLSFTLTGAETPGGGLLVFVEFTITPPAVNPPVFVASYETSDEDTLSSIATSLAIELMKAGPSGMAAAPTGTQVTMLPPPGKALSITNADRSAIDDHQYFDDWVRGGIQVTPAPGGGSGTLGCIATTVPTPDYPQGKVVGLTNHHVVRPETPDSTNLVATVNPGGQIVLSLSDTNPIATDSVVALRIFDGTGNTVIAEAEYVTAPGDTLANVANGLAGVVTGLSLGLTVTPSGSTLTITGAPIVAVTRGPLQATDNFSAAVDRNSIAYNGTVQGDDEGLYLDIFPGGSNPSFGVFVNPPKNADGNAMATAVWQAFNALPAAVRASVAMDQPHANIITLHNIEAVESRVTHDIRVGQPDASFGSSCCHCCSHRIGRVMDVRFDLDVALIQLDPDIKYKPEIQDIDLVAGVMPPTASMTVFKRGRTTQRISAASAGTVRAVDLAGHVITTGVAGTTLRFYNNVFMVQSANNFPFSLPGDSGAAVTDGAHNLVGINWGHNGLIAFATPIDVIVAAFPALGLNFAPAPAAGQDPHAVRVVPHPAAHMVAAADPRARAVPSMASAPIRDRLLEAEKEVIAMPAGQKYAALIRSHFEEGLKLINGNRKVATAWHRNGGPELLQSIFGVIQQSDRRLPVQLQGRPLSECLTRILRVMARYASPRFAVDLELHGPRLAGIAGLSYNDVLSTLQSWSEEQ